LEGADMTEVRRVFAKIVVIIDGKEEVTCSRVCRQNA